MVKSIKTNFKNNPNLNQPNSYIMKNLSLIFIAIVFFGVSCKKKSDTSEQNHNETENTEVQKKLPTADNSQTSLDWNGTYKGILPCADCVGIETQIRLENNLSYTKTEKYLGKSDSLFKSQGQFEWNDAGSKIYLNKDQKQTYQVGENKLFALDQNGERITGSLEDQYILNKLYKNNQWLETYWKLTEIDGNPIDTASLQNEAHLVFRVNDSLVAGSGGCNRLSGSYSLKPNQGIAFSQMRSTMMACKNMSVEQELNKALQTVSQYKIQNDSLKFLNKDNQVMLKFNK